ncbi:MAG: ABC transporter ATP-binding protein/permease, partial [Anaerolineae bacterium]|nr:ABC transporter ATP-binding protein/permease [Anaerolineae bacterium]
MKQANNRGLTQRFLHDMLPYMKQVAGLLVIGSVGGLVMNTAVVLPAILLGRTIDTAMAWGAGQAAGSDVWRAGLAYAGATAFYQGARLVKRWGLRMGNQRIMASVRADALRGVLNWPMERLSQVSIGDLMARIVGDVDVMGRGISELTTEMWDTVLFSVSLIAAMLLYDPGLTLLALLPVPLGMVLAKAVGRWVSARTTDVRTASAALTAFLQERLVGLRVVRLFGWVPRTVERAAELSDGLARANLAAIRLHSGLRPIYRLLMIAGIVFVIWLGGRRVAEGMMTLGAFMAYLDLYSRFVGRGHRVPQLFNSVQSGTAAYARLEPLLAEPVSSGISWRSTFRPSHVPQLDQAIPSRPTRTPHPLAVTFDHVTFRYPSSDTAVLHDVSLSIPAGSIVAVTGPVGGGKSALARALLGLYPLESGQITMDGQTVEDRDPAETTN